METRIDPVQPDPVPDPPEPSGLEAARGAFLRALGLRLDELTPQSRAVLEALSEEVLCLRDEIDRMRAELKSAALLADNDALCPLFNRRAFERELRREIALAERFGHPLTLLYLDLDGFKAVNDRYGHATGDRVLQHVCAILREHTRETDILGRFGGDEFGILLARAPLRAGRAKADELARRIDALQVRDTGTDARSVVKLGASIGVAAWRKGWPPEVLISEADVAMYAAKSVRKRSQGRN